MEIKYYLVKTGGRYLITSGGADQGDVFFKTAQDAIDAWVYANPGEVLNVMIE